MARRLVLILVVGAALIGLLWHSQQAHGPLMVSGFIEADEMRIGSRVGGRVAKVHVEEGQRVDAGAVIVELEPYDLNERRAEALARLNELKAHLLQLENGPRPQEIAASTARLDLARAQLELARTTQQRVDKAFAGGAATPDERDRSREQHDSAAAQVRVREQEVALLRDGTRSEEVTRARAAVDAAAAALGAVDRQIQELSVVAPAASVVEAVDLQPGDLVAPNAPVVSLIDVTRLWVRAYVPEDALDITVGHAVQVTVDSFPDRRFAGHVSFIARNAEFTPGNVQTPEDRSRQVFRIKVVLDEGLDVLRPGMAADVWLEKPAGAP